MNNYWIFYHHPEVHFRSGFHQNILFCVITLLVTKRNKSSEKKKFLTFSVSNSYKSPVNGSKCLFFMGISPKHFLEPKE